MNKSNSNILLIMADSFRHDFLGSSGQLRYKEGYGYYNKRLGFFDTPKIGLRKKK